MTKNVKHRKDTVSKKIIEIGEYNNKRSVEYSSNNKNIEFTQNNIF
jgi:hypothetical protein